MHSITMSDEIQDIALRWGRLMKVNHPQATTQTACVDPDVQHVRFSLWSHSSSKPSSCLDALAMS
jgi:hypothetical protein